MESEINWEEIKEITLGGETLMTKILGRQLKEKGAELLQELEKELERKRFTLKHLSSASGMFYNWVECQCCNEPTVEIIGQYKTLRYGINYEYNIHYPKSVIKIGKIKHDGREYTIHLTQDLRVIAIYNNYLREIGWTTIISQIIDQVNSWYSAVSGITDILSKVYKELKDYKTKNTLILPENIKEIVEEILKYIYEKEQEVEKEMKMKYIK